MAQVNPPAVKPGFFSTAEGHAVISLAVTAVLSVLTQLLNDPSLAQTLGIGGSILSVIKLVVDLIRQGVPNFFTS